MERFDSIYLFTTENIAGYMNELDLTGKKIITVTGSSDHIINSIFKGCTNITTFDINPLTKYYMDLKIAAIKALSFEDFMNFILYDTEKTFSLEIIERLKMDKQSKKFWIDEINKYKNDGIKLKHSALFNIKYYNEKNKVECNLYLKKENYDKIKEKLDNVKIKFINSNLIDLELEEKYDYMFLSNISDYVEKLYKDNYLNNYNKLICKFHEKVKLIYFAYLYDVDSNKKRSVIDNIDNVKKVFGKINIKSFKSALINVKEGTKDVVLIKEE